MKELTEVFMIDNKVVTQIGCANSVKVFLHESRNSQEVTLFLTKGCRVIASIDINADCGQNMGFIDTVTFKGEE